MRETTFYMVWNPQGRNPTCRHGTASDATKEAERLAANNPGQKFFVLHAISVSEIVKVVTTTLDDRDLIPF